MAEGETIRPADLALKTAHDSGGRLEEMSLEEVESHLIRKTLARFGGNVSQAAQALGLSRSAFYRRMQRFRL
jgi:transcriptional regulator of acetoin/glycerol metabolism